MALDTNLTPEIVNSFNVYIDGVKAIGTAPEITLPQITSETIDVSGSGMQLRRWQTSAARRSGWARPWHRPS